jgi:hypothetical protein
MSDDTKRIVQAPLRTEYLGLAANLIKWGAPAVGGGALFVNSATTGFFPEDIDLGEGIAIYFLSIGFLIAYAAYWVMLTSIGVCTSRLLRGVYRQFGKRAPKHAPGYLPADIDALSSWPIWILATVAALATEAMFAPRGWLLAQLLMLALLQGFLAVMLLYLYRSRTFHASGVLIDAQIDTTRRAMEHARPALPVLLTAWLVLPIFLAPSGSSFFDAAFEIAQLRKDKATVHIANPWDRRLLDQGFTKSESFLGATYSRFTNVNVRLRSIGSTVVLELPSDGTKPIFIGIPKQAIEID